MRGFASRLRDVGIMAVSEDGRPAGFDRVAAGLIRTYDSGSPELDGLRRLTGCLVVAYLLTVAGRGGGPKELEPSILHRLRGLLLRLPPRLREVLEARYFLDLELAEIGARLRISEAEVARLHAGGLEKVLDGWQSSAAARSR